MRAVVIGLGGVAVAILGGVLLPRLLPGVEEGLQTQASAAVIASNQPWASVRMDGQAADVAGTPPSPEARAALETALLHSKWRGGVFVGGVTTVRFAHDAASAAATADAATEAASADSTCETSIQTALGRETIRFQSGGYQLTNESAAAVDRAAAALQACPSAPIVTVEGHTDNTGVTQANRLISGARAQSVADRMEAAGIDPARLRVVGLGADRPRAGNETAEGRAMNRRIELVVGSAEGG